MIRPEEAKPTGVEMVVAVSRLASARDWLSKCNALVSRKVFAQMFTVGTWRGVGFLIGMTTNIILVRQLGAADYGVLAVAVTVITLFASIVGEALDLAMLRYVSLKRNDDADSVDDTLTISVALKGLTIILIACPVLMIGYVWASPFNAAGAGTSYLGPITICLFGTVLARSFATFFQAKEQFSKYLWTELTQTVSKFLAVGMLIGSGLLTVYNTLLVFAVAPFLAVAAVSRWHPHRSWLNFKQGYPMARSLLGFAKWVMLSFAIAAMHSRLDVLLLSYFRESQEVGRYAAAQALASVPEILAGFLCGVLMPKIMPLSESGRFQKYLRVSLVYTLPMCVLACLITWFLGPQVVRLLYGTGYEEAIQLFQILAVGSLVWCVALPLATPFICMQKPRWEIVLNVLVFLFTAGGSLLVIPQFGTTGTAILIAGIKILVTAVSLWLAFKISARVPSRHQELVASE